MRSMLAGLRPVSSERKGMLGKQFSKGDGVKVVDIGRVGFPVTDVFWIFFFRVELVQSALARLRELSISKVK